MVPFGFDGKRNIYIVNDYKLGIRLKHIGTKVKDGDPAEFKVQSFWSNDVPMFNADFFAPIFDDKSGEITATFNQLKVDDAWATDIAKINGLAPGVILKIQGDTGLAATKNVKNNSDLLLGSDFDLKSGGTLTMLVQSDGKFKELSRTSEAPATPEDTPVLYEGASLDSDDGKEFVYDGTGALTITEVLNGVPGQQIKISGKAGAASDVTINDAATISVVSTAVLATNDDYVEFVYVDGKWTEFNRVIA